MSSEFIKSSMKLEDWIIKSALPFWRSRGLSSARGGHVERLDNNGNPDWGANIRMRVQSRQLFVFAYAHHLGWIEDVDEHANTLFQFSESQRLDTLFPHLFDAQFNVVDSRRDVYDYAFHILAYAWYYRSFKNDSALTVAKSLVEYLDAEFASPSGGWVEGNYVADCRRQNPHMHLLESFMALYKASGDEYWLKRAEEIVGLFKTYFYDSGRRLLFENFNSDWSVCLEPGKYYVEPGHMMEWVWLLNAFSNFSGQDCSQYCDSLLQAVNEFGFSKSGLIYDRIDVNGTPLVRTMRCWPMTEAIKGCVSQVKDSNSEELSQATNHIESLFKYFICSDPKGGYIDQCDEEGKILDGNMPASTLYHLIVAAGEASALRNRLFS